jgi:hypothetical protein
VCDSLSCPSGCCSGGLCYDPVLAHCGIGGVTCVACDPARADNCAADGSCRCGARSVCTGTRICAAGRCVTP